MKNVTKQIIIHSAFGVYILLMLWLMFGQRLYHELSSPNSVWMQNYWSEFREKLNIVPFETIALYTRSLFGGVNRAAVVNLAGNVVMFVPLGLLLPHIAKKAEKFIGCFVISLVCILSAEIVQVFTLLGYFDVDDLLLNMIGVSIGFGLQKLILKGKVKC